MSNEKTNQTDRETHPLHEWLPTVILKFLVFVAFAFVLFEATVGLGEHELGSGRVGVIIAGMAGLLLLLAIDRLTALKFSASGVEATLAEAKAHAMEEVGALDNPEVAETARAQILQAKSADQVHAAMKEAVELNVTRMADMAAKAIHDRYKCYVRYRPEPDDPVQTYHVAILDIKPGKPATTRANDYLWVYSYEHESILSLRLDRVLGIEMSKEMFDPEDLMAGWKKEPDWNVDREW